jgi:hypothetical protein
VTAEIAILNKGAVALAADSAVTISVGAGQKIYNTVNKLFTLSKYRPVGIMIHGGAEFMGIPWESIIKEYRRQLAKTEYDNLRQYANGFISWIKTSNLLFPAALQQQFLLGAVRADFQQFKNQIQQRVSDSIKKSAITEAEVKQIVHGVIGEHCKAWRSFPRLTSMGADFEAHFIARHGSEIDQIRQEVFENLPIEPAEQQLLRELIADFYCRERFSDGASGVIIAGFGSKEVFPSLIHCMIDRMVDDSLKWKEVNSAEILQTNNATIIPFAQREMVDTFLSGVDPAYLGTLLGALNALLRTSVEEVLKAIPDAALPNKDELKSELVKKIPGLIDSFRDKLQNYSRDRHIAPIMNAVAALPKDELAAMAESLVNLTSFRRRVSTDPETVGGQIDVAVISKGDGFIWIKRKHYFDIGKNPQFMANYYAEA